MHYLVRLREKMGLSNYELEIQKIYQDAYLSLPVPLRNNTIFAAMLFALAI